MSERVVLVHGLWMPGLSMHWLAARLAEAGYVPEIFDYPTVAGGPDAAEPRLVEALRAPGHLLAHSLGGLLALTVLQRHPQLPVRRVVCLGSPLCGSAAAEGLARHAWSAAALGDSAALLRQGCRPWRGPAQVGMIAGRRALGLGRWFGRFRGDSDGTVALAETRLDGLADHVVLPVSHSGLLVSHEAASQALRFLAHGRFARAG